MRVSIYGSRDGGDHNLFRGEDGGDPPRSTEATGWAKDTIPGDRKRAQNGYQIIGIIDSWDAVTSNIYISMMISMMISKVIQMHEHRHEMRHMAMVPKGFLRYQVLKLLSEKPMSGSEIMGEMERMTNGRWKPSPGSIYPLLAWMQDKGYVREVKEQEVGVRRYALTDEGRTLLEEDSKVQKELSERYRHFRGHFGPKYGFMGHMRSGPYPEGTRELWGAARDLTMAFMNIRRTLGQEYSDEVAKEAREALVEATRKLEEIVSKGSKK
jgi:DNA-binding PadR family transcriptional regulator